MPRHIVKASGGCVFCSSTFMSFLLGRIFIVKLLFVPLDLRYRFLRQHYRIWIRFTFIPRVRCLSTYSFFIPLAAGGYRLPPYGVLRCSNSGGSKALVRCQATPPAAFCAA